MPRLNLRHASHTPWEVQSFAIQETLMGLVLASFNLTLLIRRNRCRPQQR